VLIFFERNWNIVVRPQQQWRSQEFSMKEGGWRSSEGGARSAGQLHSRIAV